MTEETIWYFVLAAQATPILFAFPPFWGLEVLFLLLALAALVTKGRESPQEYSSHAPLLWLLAGPVLITTTALWQRNALAGNEAGFYWQNILLLILVLSELVLAVWLVRRLQHKGVAVLAGLVGLWYSAGTFLVASWAITDAWP